MADVEPKLRPVANCLQGQLLHKCCSYSPKCYRTYSVRVVVEVSNMIPSSNEKLGWYEVALIKECSLYLIPCSGQQLRVVGFSVPDSSCSYCVHVCPVGSYQSEVPREREWVGGKLRHWVWKGYDSILVHLRKICEAEKLYVSYKLLHCTSKTGTMLLSSCRASLRSINYCHLHYRRGILIFKNTKYQHAQYVCTSTTLTLAIVSVSRYSTASLESMVNWCSVLKFDLEYQSGTRLDHAF